MIRQKKVHSGIFTADRIEAAESPGDIEQAAKTIFKNMGLDSMIKGYEAQAKETLKGQGYPDNLAELWQLDDLPAQIQDIKTMLHRFDIVREKVQENDAEWAAWNMALAIHAAIRAQIRPIEPTIQKGVEFTAKKAEGYKTKVLYGVELRKAFADHLIGKRPTLNASQLTLKILDETRALSFRYQGLKYDVFRINKEGKDGKRSFYISFKSEAATFDYSITTFEDTIRDRKNLR